MNVIFGEDQVKELKGKYTLLELDTLSWHGKDEHITCYAVIGPGDMVFDKFAQLKHLLPVHAALLKNYKLQNWEFCKTAITELLGNICPFLDEFYVILLNRISKEAINPTENWTPVVHVSHEINH